MVKGIADREETGKRNLSESELKNLKSWKGDWKAWRYNYDEELVPWILPCSTEYQLSQFPKTGICQGDLRSICSNNGIINPSSPKQPEHKEIVISGRCKLRYRPHGVKRTSHEYRCNSMLLPEAQEIPPHRPQDQKSTNNHEQRHSYKSLRSLSEIQGIPPTQQSTIPTVPPGFEQQFGYGNCNPNLGRGNPIRSLSAENLWTGTEEPNTIPKPSYKTASAEFLRWSVLHSKEFIPAAHRNKAHHEVPTTRPLLDEHKCLADKDLTNTTSTLKRIGHIFKEKVVVAAKSIESFEVPQQLQLAKETIESDSQTDVPPVSKSQPSILVDAVIQTVDDS